MKIKIEKFIPTGKGNRILGYANVNFADSVTVRGIRLIQGHNGIFMAMPQEQGADQKWYDKIRIIDEPTRLKLQAMMIKAYEKELSHED